MTDDDLITLRHAELFLRDYFHLRDSMLIGDSDVYDARLVETGTRLDNLVSRWETISHVQDS